MSFILDQLKKSGKKRELELAMRSKAGIPSRETAGASRTDVQRASVSGMRVRGIYLLVFLAAVSFSALGSFILFRGNPWSRQEPVAVVSTKTQVHTAGPSVSKTESARPESVLQVDSERSMPLKPRPEAGPEKAVPAPALVTRTQDDEVISSSPVAVAEPTNQQVSASETQIATPLPERKSEPKDDTRRTPYLSELSESLKSALPPIRISSHLYKGDSRLVSINGRIMSEGISVADGLVLDEITPEGVILSFRGQRFRVRAD